MAETQPDHEGAWYCGNRPQFDEFGCRNFCPVEGCPRDYCARDNGWQFDDQSPPEVTGIRASAHD